MSINVFEDQKNFMQAGDQLVDQYNKDQLDLYVSLIDEELAEVKEGIVNNDRVEILDGLIDVLVVTIGALHSLGCDPQGAWDEVIRSNMSKVDPASGKLIKRESDGKILKHSGYSAPVLESYVNV
jgi:predicted HAD superfamily Cof-like phosphohydrolase